MEKKIKELIRNKIYILIEDENIKSKDNIEINLNEIENKIYEKIVYLKDIENIDLYIEIIDNYII